jgi:imidazolonepropionase-like amidohydrolase
MVRLFCFTPLLLLMAACEKQQPAVASPDHELIVHCGTLIDGLTDAPFQDRLIVIRNERIAAILPGNDPTYSDADVLKLHRHTCLPGLIDTHVHLDSLPDDAKDYRIYLRRTPADTARLAEQLAEIVLNEGFTTIRHVGAYMDRIDRNVKTRIEAGEITGPRIQVAGPYLTIPHGGGDMYIPGIDDSEIPDYFRRGVARGPEEFRARAKQLVADGAEFLKVIASGAVFSHSSDPGGPEMTREEIAAVVAVADAAGIKVTAHAHSAESIKDAILAGVSSIEHASLGDDESIALALQHNVALSMDVYNGTYTEDVGVEDGYADEFMEKNTLTTEAQRIFFEKAVAAGVTILFGTDLGVLPHDMGSHQFEVMVERGMSPMQAIMSATSVAADHMGVSANVGAIEVGRYGDLVAVPGNPLQDIGLLQKVEVVVKGGSVVRSTEPTTMRVRIK